MSDSDSSTSSSGESENYELNWNGCRGVGTLLTKYGFGWKNDTVTIRGDVKSLFTEIISLSDDLGHRHLLNNMGAMFGVYREDIGLLDHAKREAWKAHSRKSDIPWSEFIYRVHDNRSAQLWLYRYVSYFVPIQKHNSGSVCTAMRNRANLILKNGVGDHKEAVALLEKAFDHGSIESAEHLGYYYTKGAKGIKKNKKLARVWYEKAAHKGHLQSMLLVGTAMIRGGRGYAKDPQLGFQWIDKAYKDNINNTNNIYLMYCANALGYCYAEGLGVEKNVPKAIELWEFAAKNENETALVLLIRTYIFGRYGERKDKARAVEYISTARRVLKKCARWNLFITKYVRCKGLDKALALEW